MRILEVPKQRRGLTVIVATVVLMILVQSNSFGEQHTAKPAAVPAAADVQAIALNVHEVELQWSQATGASVYGYTIRRNQALLTTLYGDVHVFNDRSVQASTTYSYTVTTLSTTWIDSPPSASVEVRTPALPETPDTRPPSPPQDLSAVLRASDIHLDWYDASDNSDISAYQIRRDGLLLATVDSGTLNYTDTTTISNTVYLYSVEALDVVGFHSAPSNIAEIESMPYPAP